MDWGSAFCPPPIKKETWELGNSKLTFKGIINELCIRLMCLKKSKRQIWWTTKFSLLVTLFFFLCNKERI